MRPHRLLPALLAAALLSLACRSDGPAAVGAPEPPAAPAPPAPATAAGATLALPLGAACAIGGDGRAWCWGGNVDGVAGDPARADGEAAASPRPIASDARYVALAATATDQSDTPLTVCALTADGAADCWGANVGGLLGAPDAAPCPSHLAGGAHRCTRTPTRLATALRFRRLAVGPDLLCGIATDEQTYCWGFGPTGQLGTGRVGVATAPTPVAGGHRFVDLSAGETVVCGLTADGVAWCWGEGALGQLGDGRSRPSSVPVRVAASEPFAQVAPHDRYTCGVTRNGAVHCWGWGAYWTLAAATPVRVRGANAPTPEFLPLRVGALSIGVGAGHHCVRAVGGETVCWGWNRYNQVGPSGRPGCTTTAVQEDCTPGAVATGLTFAELRVGPLHACGRTAEGAVYCWGSNAYGESGGAPVDGQQEAVRVPLP
jgi:alpha-tubulin suppressor-like RCC1 family protein